MINISQTLKQDNSSNDVLLSQISYLQNYLSTLKNGSKTCPLSTSIMIPESVSCSYQQLIQQDIIQAYRKYFNNIGQCYKNSIINKNQNGRKQSKIFNKLVSEYMLLGHSLWSYADQVIQYVKNNTSQQQQSKFVIVEHNHYQSQSVLFALYTKLINNKNRVKLLSSKKQIQRGWTTCTVSINQVDKKSAFKALMTEQDIDIQYFQSFQEQIQNIEQLVQGAISTDIIDVFNTHSAVYRPSLYKYMKKYADNDKNRSKIRVIYVHPSQTKQITQFLSQLIKTNTDIKDITSCISVLSICTTFPHESSTLANSQKLDEQLITFLKQQVNHPTKQDIIIFHDNNQQYIKHIKNLLKKNELKNVNIVNNRNMNVVKEALPNPPAFLNQVLNLPMFADLKVNQAQSPKKIQKKLEEKKEQQKKQQQKQEQKQEQKIQVPKIQQQKKQEQQKQQQKVQQKKQEKQENQNQHKVNQQDIKMGEQQARKAVQQKRIMQEQERLKKQEQMQRKKLAQQQIKQRQQVKIQQKKQQQPAKNKEQQQKPKQVQQKNQKIQKQNENILLDKKESKISENSSIIKTPSLLTTSSLRISSISSNVKRTVHTQNNIFIVADYNTLMSWNYDLAHVFYVFDYRNDSKFYYDYQLVSYIQSEEQYITSKQAMCRMSCMAVNRVGKYCFVKNNRSQQQDDKKIRVNTQKIVQEQELGKQVNLSSMSVGDGNMKDIGYYVLSMIQGGFLKQNQECQQVKSCIKVLLQAKIIQKQQSDKYTIARQDIYKCLSKMRDLNPILCLSILSARDGQQHDIAPAKLAILLSMAASIMMSSGNLRSVQSGNNSASNRLTAIWRQTGYLHSCLDLLVRAKIIQHRQHQIAQGKKSRRSVSRKVSKQNSQEFEVFGDLFQIIAADRITFDQMKIQDLLRQQLVNQTVFHNIVQKAEKICQVTGLDDYTFTSLQIKDVNTIIATLAKQYMDRAIGIYSGSRRIGYFVKNQKDGLFPSKSSLMALLNQRPSYAFITRLVSYTQLPQNGIQINNPTIEIVSSLAIAQMLLFQTLGLTLPARKTASYGQSQIQYHGISSATFKYMFRNDAAQITAFQTKYSCFVELNQQIALVSIHCSKESEENIRKQFTNYLNKIKQKMAAQTKILHYLGATSLLFGSGGKIQQVIKDKYINKCALANLDLQVQVQDLQQLFQQFFNLKSIKVMRQPPSCSFKTAYIQFQSQKDYYRFHQYFNQCLYLNRYIRVLPIQSIPTASVYKQQMYIQFIWTAWRSSCQAIVQFQQYEGLVKCCESLKQAGFDGQKVTIKQKDNNTVYIKGMNPLTDEVNLQLGLQVYGKIKHIEILKTPIKQNLKSLQTQLQDQIRKKMPGALDIQIKKVQKLKNGLRKCIVMYKNQQKLNETIVNMNQKTGIMGIGRVHLKSWFIYPIKVAHGYFTLYEQLINIALSKMPNNRVKIESTIYNEQEYIIGKSNMKQQIDAFKLAINQQLQGYPVPLTGYQSSILLTQVGIRNLIDMEQKYNCRLIPDFGKKTLTVLALFDDVKTIKQQIKAKVTDNFFYRIPLNIKSFKHFKEKPQLCQTMKKQYFLTEFQLEEVGRNILLEGSANNVQKAFNYLMHVIQSVSKPTQQQMLNADVCGICCQEPFRPYRLQQCSHKFCMNCILDAINSSLGDISAFPLKCPQCLAQIAMIDLNQLLTQQTWPKLKNMALNLYVGRNPEIISNCYTAGCKQVNFLISTYFNCDECNSSYCTGCKLNYHPGLTCEQAKQGGNAAFQKYMKQNGIRKCPNQACKMPITRIDGCYRVTCPKCNKSMCFKCQAQKMIAYDHYNDCYKHLTDVHGGYW